MPTHPTQEFLREIRENLDPALIDFVQKDVTAGHQYSVTGLWLRYNGQRGYCGDGPTFRYALERAGMVSIPGSRKMIKPIPSDTP